MASTVALLDVLSDAFKAYDAHGEGLIAAGDVRSALERAGRAPPNASAVADLLRSLKGSDAPHPGLCSFAEFAGLFDLPAEAFLLGAGPSLLGGEAVGGARASAALDEGPDVRLLEFLVTLENYRAKCEVEGSYEEAARCSDQLALLRKQEEARRVQAWKARHVAERSDVAEAHAAQYREFNGSWDRYLAEYDAMAAMYVQQMQTRHADKLRAFQEALHHELVKKPLKFGREVLDWRSREAMLVKQRKYGEAARIKAVADELETRERSRLDEERIAALALREAKHRAQQRTELEALLKRIDTRRSDHAKQRAVDSTRLLQRNRNVMAVLVGRQASEEREVLLQIKASLAPPRSAIQARAALSSVATARAGSTHRLKAAGAEIGSPTHKGVADY